MSNRSANRPAAPTSPETLIAEVIDVELADWLLARDSSEARATVHSVFRHAANIWADGTLFTIGASTLGPAPRTILVDRLDLTRLSLSAGKPVIVASGEVQIMGLGARPETTIRWGTSRRWRPILPKFSETGRDRAASSSALLLRAFEATAARAGRGLLDRAQIETALNAALRLHVDGLIAALVSKQYSAMRAHTAALIGLGRGLTPTGDDFLAGLAAVFAMAGSGLQQFTAPLASTVEEHRSATGDVSYAMLELALQGKVRAPIAELLMAAGNGDVRGLRKAVPSVLAIGMSSGADTIWGIASALHLVSLAARTRSPHPNTFG